MVRTIPFALAAVFALAAFGAQAAGEPPGLKRQQASESPLAIGTVHKLQKTYFDTGNTTTALAVGLNPVGTTLTLNCANTAGCTVAANMNAQLAAAGSENAAAICLVIDGSSVNCPFNGIIRAGSGFQVMNYETFASVALGNHTVQMNVFTSVATNIIRWNKEIKLYKP